MDVDLDNFRQARQVIKSQGLIKRCKAISFDLEFTGVKFENNERERPQQLPTERYKKMKSVVTKFSVIQLGLTFFVPEANEDMKAYPFNFYLFPRQNPLRDPVISMQGGAVEFNSAQNMDWNRWIRKGIPYVKISEVAQLQSLKKNSRSFDQLMENADISIVQTIVAIVNAGKTLNSTNKSIKLQIPKLNFYNVKRIAEKYIETENFTIKFSTDQNPNFDKTTIFLEYISPEDKQSLKQIQLQATIGFTLIFQEIWKSGKTFIGHNCMFDLLYIYESLVAPLPENLMGFKEELKKDGRKFYDTKVIANKFDNKNDIFPNGTSLEVIYNYLTKSERELVKTGENIRLAEGFAAYDLDKPALHEAGFDSYLTGWIFYQLWKKFADVPETEGIVNLFKSYFQLRLGKSDTLLPDLDVFVLVVYPPSKFVQREEIWKQKQEVSRQLKQSLKNENIYQYTQCRDGFKEIYIEVRDRAKTKEVAVKLIQLVASKKIPEICSLPSFIQLRSKHSMVQKNNF